MAIIYGIHPVQEALNAGKVERLVVLRDNDNLRVAQLVAQARDLRIDVRQEPRHRMEALAGGVAHQGIVAYVTQPRAWGIEDMVDNAGESPLFLLLDGIEDPHNLGAILRSADGAGVTGVILPKRRAASVTDTVWKVSAGAAQYVPVARVANISQAIEFLKSRGVWVIGTDLSGDCEWHEVDYTGPVAIVMGREGEGLHQLVKRHCDHLVRLPMLGAIQSLNVSVSTGIMLYEVVRQRRSQGTRGE